MITPAHPYRLGRKEFSLGKNRNYQYVYHRGKGTHSRYIVLVYVPAAELRVGYSVSSKVGCAVVRNRIRRIFKEDFRMMRGSVKEGKYIFIARVNAKDARHSELTANMRAVVKKAGLLKTAAPSDVS